VPWAAGPGEDVYLTMCAVTQPNTRKEVFFYFYFYFVSTVLHIHSGIKTDIHSGMKTHIQGEEGGDYIRSR
jgi:hypothetical protein